MKYLSLWLLILTLVLSNRTYGQDTINWSANYKLRWSDFKAQPDTGRLQEAAVSALHIRYNLSFDAATYNYHVFCYFDRDKSWTRDTVNKSLLQHEQLHFDIAEYYARKLATAFANYTFNRSTIKKDFDVIYTTLITEYDVVDNTYDHETEHSKNKKQQELWNQKIAAQLLAFPVLRGVATNAGLTDKSISFLLRNVSIHSSLRQRHGTCGSCR